MIAQVKWTERRFDFSFPPGLYPNILERLRGTPARIEEMTRNLSPAVLTKKEGEAWSVQEHVGHLIDLEVLHEGRIDDFIEGKAELRAADMTNRRTHEARHNNNSLIILQDNFRAGRMHYVNRLENIDESIMMRVALHPRLNQRMRVVDMMYFVAEHDDHHLAIITRLVRKYS